MTTKYILYLIQSNTTHHTQTLLSDPWLVITPLLIEVTYCTTVLYSTESYQRHFNLIPVMLELLVERVYPISILSHA